MRLWPRSTADRIREAFAFLVETHGYRLVADSDGGMGGSITYRSEGLWIAVEWDRGEPWLEFSPTRSSVGRFDWDLVDHVLRGEAFARADVPAREAPADELAAWLRAHLAEIEAAFAPPRREDTQARLRAVDSERRRLRERYWAARPPRGAT
jgi:hypothetical protein